MRKPLFILLILSSCWCIYLPAQSPKHEFRAVWVSTLANLDWPSRQGMSSYAQKQELLYLLDDFEEAGINAVIFQVRPAGDAFYSSSLVPWSQYLTGKQGRAPSPWYDPLSFLVRECHARNMELHAWFNPYRAVSHVDYNKLAPNNPSKKHPNWVFKYGVSKYFDPGIPDVRRHIIDVVMEVVRDYDIDGVHFDDYFYPYPIKGERIKDGQSYMNYGMAFRSRDDWRRYNVNRMIRILSDSIRSVKPKIKFGISPFGVWRNKGQDAAGSPTGNMLASYDHLFADSKKWLEEGWIDYIAPQLYWGEWHRSAPFSRLVNWWVGLESDRHVYAGHSLFFLEAKDNYPKVKAREYAAQVRYCQRTPGVQGSLFFRASNLRDNLNGVRDSLARCYAQPCLIPPMPWKDSLPPNRPRSLNISPRSDGMELNWKPPTTATDGDTAAYYVIYRFPHSESIDLNKADCILSIQKDYWFLDQSATPGNTYHYALTAVDRMHNENKRYLYRTVKFIQP